MKYLLLTVLLSLYCIFLGSISLANEIHWFSDDVQDNVKLTTPITQPISISVDTTRLLMNALEHYQFNIEFAQIPSISLLLKKLPNSCAPNRLKTTKRLAENLYSLPLNLYLDLHIYYKKESGHPALPQAAINEKNQLVSLASLFTGKNAYTLGVDNGRSFGDFLDKQIAALDSHNLIIRKGGQRSTSLANMLIKNRIDFVLDYPISMKNALKNHPESVELTSLEVAGNQQYIVGYVACNKGDIGKKVIEDINAALRKLYHQYSFYQAHIRYLDKADIADFNRAYNVIYKAEIPSKPTP